MDQVEVLKRRIHVAEELYSLVRTMKSMAAVNIRQLELAVQSLRSFHDAIEAGFQAVLQGGPNVPLVDTAELGSGAGLLAIGSDQGMCGPLNESLARQCVAWSQQDSHTADSRVPTRSIFCVGLRLAARLEEAGLPVHQSQSMAQSRSGLSMLVDELTVELERWQREHRLASVDIVFAAHRSRSSFDVQQTRLLPLDSEWLRQLQVRPWPSGQVPLVWGDRQTRFIELTSEYLFCELYRACAETLASENASRLLAMRLAEQNIERRRDELVRQYREARQTAITEELLDIASGFEAIEGGD